MFISYFVLSLTLTGKRALLLLLLPHTLNSFRRRVQIVHGWVVAPLWTQWFHQLGSSNQPPKTLLFQTQNPKKKTLTGSFFFFLQNKISNNIQINKLKVLKNKKYIYIYIYGEDEVNIGMVFRGVCIYLKLPAFFELIATVKVQVTVTELGDNIQNTHHWDSLKRQKASKWFKDDSNREDFRWFFRKVSEVCISYK